MAKPLQTLALLGSLRTLLFLFNVVFLATGAVFLLAGMWIALNMHKYLELDSDVSSGLPLIFSGLGLFVLVLASSACHCAVRGAAPKIYVYSTLLFVVFVGELLLLLFAYYSRQSVASAFHDGLSRGLAEYGKDYVRTAAVDDIQATLHCCGVSNFSDWQATPWGEGHGPNKMPPSCCRWTQAGVCGPKENERGIAELHSTGCYRLVKNFVVDNIQAIGLGVVVAGVIHGLGIVLACILARNVSKAEYEELREFAASSATPANALANKDKSRQPMLSTASRPQTASNGGGNGNGAASGSQYMQQQLPPPVIADSKELKKSKQKLKQTKASKAERRAKRAQSIDWTSADNHPSAAAATLAHANANNIPAEPSMANHEDYYSVPRKCHRAVSSTFLDQPVAPTAEMVTSAESCPWNEGGPCSFGGFAIPPQPPSSPPPTPPNRHSLHGGGISEMGVTDSVGDQILTGSRYYS